MGSAGLRDAGASGAAGVPLEGMAATARPGRNPSRRRLRHGPYRFVAFGNPAIQGRELTVSGGAHHADGYDGVTHDNRCEHGCQKWCLPCERTLELRGCSGGAACSSVGRGRSMRSRYADTDSNSRCCSSLGGSIWGDSAVKSSSPFSRSSSVSANQAGSVAASSRASAPYPGAAGLLVTNLATRCRRDSRGRSMGSGLERVIQRERRDPPSVESGTRQRPHHVRAEQQRCGDVPFEADGGSDSFRGARDASVSRIVSTPARVGCASVVSVRRPADASRRPVISPTNVNRDVPSTVIAPP